MVNNVNLVKGTLVVVLLLAAMAGFDAFGNFANNQITGFVISDNDCDLDFLDYPCQFLKDDKFNGLIIVGDAAHSSDIFSAVDISNSLSEVADIQIGSVKLASEVADFRAQNVIAIGTSCSNAAVADFAGNPVDCAEGYVEGRATIKLVDHKNGNVGLTVGGYDVMDTRRAAHALANYKHWKSLGRLNGKEIIVTGTSFTDIKVRVPGGVDGGLPVENVDGSVTATLAEGEQITIYVEDDEYIVNLLSVGLAKAKFVIKVDPAGGFETVDLAVGGIRHLTNDLFITVSNIKSIGTRNAEFTIHPPADKTLKPTHTVNSDSSVTDTLKNQETKGYLFRIGGEEKAYRISPSILRSYAVVNFTVNNEGVNYLGHGGIGRVSDGTFISVSSISDKDVKFTIHPRPTVTGKPKLITTTVNVATGWNLVGLNTLQSLNSDVTTCQRNNIHNVAYIYYPEVVKSYGDGADSVVTGNYGSYSVRNDMKGLAEGTTVPGISALESNNYKKQYPEISDGQRAAWVYNKGEDCLVSSNIKTKVDSHRMTAGWNMLSSSPAWKDKSWNEISNNCESAAIFYLEDGKWVRVSVSDPLPSPGTGFWFYTKKACSITEELLQLPPLPSYLD
jgi:hypothetical protein